MTLKDLIAKLDECRAALEDEFVPDAREQCDLIEPEDEDTEESEKLRNKLFDLESALDHIEAAISNLEL